MQEEVESKSVNLAVRTTTVTARVLYQALRSYVQDTKNMAQSYRARQQTKQQMKLTKQQIKAAGKNAPKRGMQTVKQLVGQGQGVEKLEIGDSGIRDFKRIGNKYGVDFAIVKDKNSDPPVYNCFFKARDVDAISSVLKEYSAKQMKKKERSEVEKPSILEKLKQFKEIVKNTPRKDKEKRKEQER